MGDLLIEGVREGGGVEDTDFPPVPLPPLTRLPVPLALGDTGGVTLPPHRDTLGDPLPPVGLGLELTPRELVAPPPPCGEGVLPAPHE